MKPEIRLISPKVAYHRNGIGGNGFYVVTFKWHDYDDRKTRNMVAILQEERGQCFVLDSDETVAGNVEFAQGNSWRGDNFEPECRKAIDDWHTERQVARNVR